MKITKAWIAAALAALGMSACHGSPTAPNTDQLNTYTLSAHMVNASGAPTILDAQLLLDGVVVSEDNETVGFADAFFFPGSTIFAGSHTLTFLLVSQTTATGTYYTVPKFDVILSACDGGTLSDNGTFGRTIHQHTQTVNLSAGQAITYSFSSPDCTLDSTTDRLLLPGRSAPVRVKPPR